jgi:serine/threonine-protein kinase
VPDPSTSPPEDDQDPSGEETSPVNPRRDTLAASGGSDFRHGRFEPGQRLGSRYRIVARLGEGGMGEVYRADDLELGQSVALKFLPRRVSANESWLRRFRNEVRIARQIAHPNVCRIYDIGQADGHVFLSMEYVDGEDLGGVLRRLGRPSREKAVEIARQICTGLAAAHDAKILHRDLKPANIMIDGRGRVRITDFGLAGFLDELEGVQARAGTPAYMAPEQLADGRVSIRSDIYALGLIFYELFTGTCVFETNDVEELKRKHSSGSVSTPSSISDEIDPAVERVIMRCLEPRPEDRPQSVYQVLAALPGGDPLAAALAAGELPSPELVANARDTGGLQPMIAVGLLAAILVSVAASYFVSFRTIVMPQHAPSRLSVVAEQTMEELGFGELPRHSASGYDVNLKLAGSLWTAPQSADQLRQSVWPPGFRYWRRWSGSGFMPSDNHFPEQLMIDGPVDDPGGTATVAVDSTGNLIALSVAPALVESAPETAVEVDWSPIFALARLERSRATPITPESTPPVFCDTLVGWRIDADGDEVDPVTVLMGAVGGRPVYFEHVGLNDGMQPDHDAFKSEFAYVDAAWTLFSLVMIVLAVRNLRAGRVDHRNAFRCALLIGGLYAIMEVVTIATGGSDPRRQVIGLFNDRAAGHFLIHAIDVWIYYLAIEPYVRRVWPRMLIGLVRVFSGRLRDPLVGRDVLIGLATGCMFVMILVLVSTAERRLTAGGTAHLAHYWSLRIIMSPGHYFSNLAHDIAWAVGSGVWGAGVVVLIRVLVRHAIGSAVLSIAAIAFLEFGVYSTFIDDSSWAAYAFAVGMGVCLIWLYSRVGVLSAMVFFFVMRSMSLFGLDFDAWSTPYLVSWLAILLALAGYGFRVALAGQPLFADMLEEPRGAA